MKEMQKFCSKDDSGNIFATMIGMYAMPKSFVSNLVTQKFGELRETLTIESPFQAVLQIIGSVTCTVKVVKLQYRTVNMDLIGLINVKGKEMLQEQYVFLEELAE